MSVLDRHLALVTALRGAGLVVSVAESLDAVAAVRSVGLGDRETLREAYAAALVKRAQHRPAFDTIFDLYFPRTVGDGSTAPDDAPAPGDPGAATAERPSNHPGPGDGLDRLREDLAAALSEGDDQELQALAAAAVARFGRIQGRSPGTNPGLQSWSRLEVMNQVDPRGLTSRLLAAMAGVGQDRSGVAEQVHRATLQRRVRHFEELVGAEVRRRVAEELGEERIARSSVRAPLEQLDLLTVGGDDLAALRREVYPLSRRLASRLVQEQRHGRSGQLDLRRTIRESLQTGGVPMQTIHKPRRPHRTDLVLLCDVSGSVRQFAQFTMMLMFAITEQFGRVRAFAFIDDIDEVTGHLQPGQGLARSVVQLSQSARVTWVTGRTHYGRAIERFSSRYPDAVGPRTSLLMLGDARSNYGYLSEGILSELVGRSRHAHWLNPERRSLWGTGDSAAPLYSQIMPMVEARNLEQLSAFVTSLR